MYLRLFAAFTLATSALWSQALSGTIVGAVTDAAGAMVASAKVTLTNEGTHFVRTVETNERGQYVASSVPTGNYSIAVEMQGFQRTVREGVVLTAADTVTVDFKLTIGDMKQTVEVTGTAPLLQSQTAAVSQLITNQQILEMPLNGRTFTALLLLTPGAHSGSSANLDSSPYGMRGSTNYSVNGSSAQMNSYLIDGMVNRNLWLSTLIMVPTVDSIQEFRVMTSNYSAEYGAAAGAMTVVQTKSGSNDLHGSMYEFLRNDKLDANTFFNNRAGAVKPPFRRNEFGATAGGTHPPRQDVLLRRLPGHPHPAAPHHHLEHTDGGAARACWRAAISARSAPISSTPPRRTRGPTEPPCAISFPAIAFRRRVSTRRRRSCSSCCPPPLLPPQPAISLTIPCSRSAPINSTRAWTRTSAIPTACSSSTASTTRR